MKIRNRDIDALYQLLDRRAPGVIVRVTPGREGTDTVVLNLIDVPKSQRGFGMGQRVLDIICQTADAHGWSLALSPSPSLGSDMKRLVNWYFRSGFVPAQAAGQTMLRTARS